MVVSTAQRIAESDTVAIIRETGPEMIIETVDALRRDGAPTVKIAANTGSVFNMIRDVPESFAADEVTIGVGTVLDAETARATTLVGVEFIVTPSFDKGVVGTVSRYGVPSLVGIATPTEAVNAFEAGVDMMKVFPAGTFGSRFISALGGPFGYISTVPADGVGLDNVDEFSDADTTAVGAGSSIIDTEVIARDEFDVIEANARVFRETVEAARSEWEFDWL